MPEEPFGKTCIHCGDEVTSVGVIYTKSDGIASHIYMHASCFKNNPRIVIIVPRESHNSLILWDEYRLIKSPSYYTWIGGDIYVPPSPANSDRANYSV